MIKLREYQKEMVKSVEKSISVKKDTKAIVQACTGSGKTVVLARVIKNLNKKALVVAHRQELLSQAKKKIAEEGIPAKKIDIVRQSRPQKNAQVWVASIQTIIRGNRLKNINPSIVIIDEAHHAIANSYKILFKKFPNIPIIGFTATPTRSTRKEKKKLAELWTDGLLYQYPIKKAIKDGYLANIDYYRAQTNINLDKVKTIQGDFAVNELSKSINTKPRNKSIVDKYKELGGGKAIVYCADVQHAESLAKEFRRNKIRTESIFGHTPQLHRSAIINSFKETPMDEDYVTTNVSVLTEGFDCADIRQVILARPTQSEVLYLQMLGRGTRKAPNKDVIKVVDVEDNCSRKELCNALQTVFNLDPTIKVKEGSVIDQLPPASIEKKEIDVDIHLEKLNILFTLPEELKESKLDWCAPKDDCFVVQLSKNDKFIIRENYINFDLFGMGEHIKTSPDLKELVTYCEKKAKEDYTETSYFWDEKKKSRMQGHKASEKQKKLIKKIAPDVNLEELDKKKASEIISAIMNKPATVKQKKYLKSLGCKKDFEALTKREASKEIQKLKEMPI